MERCLFAWDRAVHSNHDGADRSKGDGADNHAVRALAQKDHTKCGNKDWREAELYCRGDANAGIRYRFDVCVLEERLNEPKPEAKREHPPRKSERAATE